MMEVLIELCWNTVSLLTSF